jgi:hypothetical protein
LSDIKLSVGAGDGRADRGGVDPAPRLPRRPPVPVSRHGTISRELTKYASYKLWAEKVRGAFAADPVEPPRTNGSGTPRR